MPNGKDEPTRKRMVKPKSMRILIYSVNFAPEPTGIGKYSGEMAALLVERGHEVRVVVAPPYYPNWKVDSAYRWPLYRRELWNGIDVWRAPLWVPKAPGGLRRILHLVSFAISSFPIILYQVFWQPQLVITVAPALLCAPAGLLVARLSGGRAWLHMQDFEADIAFRMNLLRGMLLQRIILRMERWLLRRFDTVSTISNRMIDLLLRKGVSLDRIRFFPNWVNISQIKATVSAANYRSQLGIQTGSLVVMYSGSLGGKQGLMVVPEAAARLAARPDIVFVICGDGVMKASLEAACAVLPNTRLLPLQPVERLGELLCLADIHLLPQGRGAQDLVLPSKLAGMLASGRPVIATCQPGTEIDAVVSSCGLVVAPEDCEALAGAICRLADDPALRMNLGRCARVYAETNFERDAIFERIFEPLEQNGAAIPDDAVA